jgi:hypothetical protein
MFYSKPFTITQAGPMDIQCVAVDEAGNIIEKTAEFSIDPAPSTPTINGPSSGKINVNHTFEIISTDQFQDSISYLIEWGDGQTTGWTSYQPSGEPFMISHRWDEKGVYEIKAKAKDEQNIESDWEYFTLELPKSNRGGANLIEFISWLLQDLFSFQSLFQFLI